MMSTGAIIAIVVVVALLIAAGVFFLLPQLRSQRLRRTFGPEYDHTVDRHGDRRAAERELTEREQRHSQYELRPLTPEVRDRYRQAWTQVQEKFIDAPREAVGEADRLVNGLVAELGYPSEGYERQLADLSVRHGHSVKHYREAHETGQREDVSTDDLREALIGYRKVFEELLEQGSREKVRH
jgi:ABC-type nickel/cobalt efflux system permease component RcnA